MAANVEQIIGIDERDINSGRIMEMTPVRTVSPEMLITVPNNYRAELIVDGEHVKTVRPCLKKKLVRIIGSDKDGKSISALYVSNRKFTSMSWGIGSLVIKYDFLDGSSVNVGASGTLIAEVSDPIAFYGSFGKSSGTLDLTECTGKITSAFRVCASKLLVEMFVEAIQPIFETEFMVSELDRRVNERVCNRELEGLPGIVFRSATVSGIRVNEEDKTAIIDRFGTKRPARR